MFTTITYLSLLGISAGAFAPAGATGIELLDKVMKFLQSCCTSLDDAYASLDGESAGRTVESFEVGLGFDLGLSHPRLDLTVNIVPNDHCPTELGVFERVALGYRSAPRVNPILLFDFFRGNGSFCQNETRAIAGCEPVFEGTAVPPNYFPLRIAEDHLLCFSARSVLHCITGWDKCVSNTMALNATARHRDASVYEFTRQ